MHLVCWLWYTSYNLSFLNELLSWSCKRKEEEEETVPLKSQPPPPKIEIYIIHPNANTNEIFCITVPKFSRSSRPKLYSITKWFLFSEDEVDRARMHSAINHDWQQTGRVFIWQQHTSPRWQNCWTAQKPDSSIASSVQSRVLGLQLGSSYLLITGLKAKLALALKKRKTFYGNKCYDHKAENMSANISELPF